MDLSFRKAELHLHLEGTIEPATLREIAARHSLPAASLSDHELVARYQYSDFLGFLMAFKWVTQHLLTPEDYGIVAFRALQRLHEQNVQYAEIYFSAGICLRKNMEVEPILDALDDARRRAEAAWGIRAQWILDAVRQFGPDAAAQVARLAARLRDRHVVGIGLGGSEEEGPPEQFCRVYELARAEGLHVVAHAGETTGPEYVWAALRSLGAERIGHGVSVMRDPTLVEYLREHRIPIEVCVTSNYATGAVALGERHPVRRMFDAGLSLVINSDDPAMFHTSLNGEYALIVDQYGFSQAEIAALARNSFHASFLTDQEKAMLDSSPSERTHETTFRASSGADGLDGDSDRRRVAGPPDGCDVRGEDER